jgi:predicted nucleic acid-binding protein
LKRNSHFALIDTSAWIEFFRIRGSTDIRERITSLILRGEAAWCEIIRLELWNGARGQPEIAALDRMESTARLLPVTPEVWRMADRLARSSREAGKTFPISDLLIAACARFYGTEVIHKDRHFDQLKTM